jgi:SWI/SNF-related matrix-associated actin-dependent regulator of chromatin subfamily D
MGVSQFKLQTTSLNLSSSNEFMKDASRYAGMYSSEMNPSTTGTIQQRPSRMTPIEVTNLKRRKRIGSMPAGDVTPYAAYDYVMPKKLMKWEPAAVSLHQLMEFERRLDSLLLRKKCDYQEAIKQPMKVKKTLRIYLYHYAVQTTINEDFTFQPSAEDSHTTYTLPPSFTFYIEGRLLETKNVSSMKRFSEYLRSLKIILKNQTLSSNEEGENYMDFIEWVKGKPSTDVQGNYTMDSFTGIKERSGPSDGFEIKRQCTTNKDKFNMTILLELEHIPEMFRLSDTLSSLFGGSILVNTRMSVSLAVWNYIKTNKLQDEDDRRMIITNEALKSVVGLDRLTFSQLPSLLDRHLLPLEPIKLNYVLDMETLSTPEQPHMTIYDVEIEVDDPFKNFMQKFTQSISSAEMTLSKDISDWDTRFIDLLYEIRQSCVKREFMQSFASQPVEFINQWIVSQAHDLKTILGEGDSMNETTLHMEDWRSRSSLFKQDWVREAISYYLHAKSFPSATFYGSHK